MPVPTGGQRLIALGPDGSGRPDESGVERPSTVRRDQRRPSPGRRGSSEPGDVGESVLSGHAYYPGLPVEMKGRPGCR